MKAQALSSNMGVGSWEGKGIELVRPAELMALIILKAVERLGVEIATMMNSRFSHLHKVQTQSKGAQR